MIWLPIHTDLPRHLKMTRLTKALNVKRAQAVGHMVMLWLWALINYDAASESSLFLCTQS